MARPFKTGVDYFPLDVLLDDKFELIESLHGLIGFGVIVKLYQKVYANSYYFNVTEKEVLKLSNRVNVDINKINAIINDSVKWEIFNQKLYDEYLVLTSTGIQKRYFEIVKRRKKVCIDKRFLLIDHALPKDVVTWINVDINSINVGAGTQSKVKESKEKVKENIRGFSEAFERWWKTYPKNRNGRRPDKKKAALVFEKISQKDWPDLKTATGHYSRECNGYPVHAHRFLRNGFWKDYLKPGKPSQKPKTEEKERSWKEIADAMEPDGLGIKLNFKD